MMRVVTCCRRDAGFGGVGDPMGRMSAGGRQAHDECIQRQSPQWLSRCGFMSYIQGYCCIEPPWHHQYRCDGRSARGISRVTGQQALARMSRGKILGLGFVFLWFLIGGVAHFAATSSEMRIMPPFIPWPRAAVLVSGAFELLGAMGLLVRRSRTSAGFGLFMLTLAVTPANIYMLERSELFGVPYWLLVMRLPVQGALLALILWSSGAWDHLRRLCRPAPLQ